MSSDKHPRDETKSHDSPKNKRAKLNPRNRQAEKNRAQGVTEQAAAARNDEHESNDDPHSEMSAKLKDVISTASQDWPLPSIEDEEVPACQGPDLSGYEAQSSDQHDTPPRSRDQSSSDRHSQRKFACSDFGSGGETTGEHAGEQRESGSGTGDSPSIDGSANPRLKQAYAMADKILREGQEQDKAYAMAEVKCLQAERKVLQAEGRCIQGLRAANTRAVEERMETLWRLLDMFHAHD